MERLDFRAVTRHLAVLDHLCEQEGVYAKLVLFGGASLLIHLGEERYRNTLDIDFQVIETSSEEKINKILAQFPGVFQVLGGFPQYPDQEMYKEDGKELFELDKVKFTNISIFLPSIEMVALSKLMTSRPKDFNDLQETEILDQCDLNKLKELADECASYMTEYELKNSNYSDWEELLSIRGLSLP